MKTSVIIRAYNRKQFLRDAVNSVREQTVKPDEVIIMKNFEDPEIDKLDGEFVLMKPSGSLGNQIKDIIMRLTGDIVLFLDDDDRFSKDKVERVKEKFSDGVSYYHNGHALIDETGNRMKGYMHKQPKTPLKVNSLSELKFAIRSRNDVSLHPILFNTSSVAIGKSVLIPYISVLPDLIDGTDWFFFFLALNEHVEMYFDPDPLTEYRIHKSVSNVIEKDEMKDIVSESTKFFNESGHFTSILRKVVTGDAKKLLNCRLLEEKMLLRSSKRIKRVTLQEVWKYQKCLPLTIHQTFRNRISRFVYTLGIFLSPGITNILLNRYKIRSYRERTGKGK